MLSSLQFVQMVFGLPVDGGGWCSGWRRGFSALGVCVWLVVVVGGNKATLYVRTRGQTG